MVAHVSVDGEAGFTLVEVVIGIGLSLLVGSLAFAVYLFGVRSFGGWQQALTLENTTHQVLEQITRDCYHTAQVTVHDDSTMTLAAGVGTPITYQYRAQVLLRQGRPLHRREVALIAFSLRAVSTPLEPTRLLADLTFQHGTRQRRMQTQVMIRQPRPWQSGEGR